MRVILSVKLLKRQEGRVKTIEPSIEYFGPFDESFCIRVRQLLFFGYSRSIGVLRSADNEETAITGYIAEALDEFLESSSCPPWCEFFSIRDDPPVKRKGTSGRSRPRADLIIEAHLYGRPQCIFEAKRLRRHGYGTSKYIDAGGMGCFISGLYASRYDEAVMIGYVQSDSVGFWKKKLVTAIEKSKDTLHLISAQRDIKVIDEFPIEWLSEHSRTQVGRPVTIHHILLDCCPQTT